MGTLLAMTLAFGFAVDWAWPDAGRPRPSRRAWMAGGFGALVTTIAVLYFTAVQMKPPADAAYKGQPRAAGGLSTWDLGVIPTTELRALVPVVHVTDEGVRWNHWLLRP